MPKRTRTQRSPLRKLSSSSSHRQLFSSNSSSSAYDHDIYYDEEEENERTAAEKENISPFTKKNKLSIDIQACTNRLSNPRISLLKDDAHVLTPTKSPTRRTLFFDKICGSPGSALVGSASTTSSTVSEDSPLNDSFSDASEFFLNGLTLNSPSSCRSATASPSICNMKFKFQSPSPTTTSPSDMMGPPPSSPIMIRSCLRRNIESSPAPDFSATAKRLVRDDDNEDYYAASSKRVKQRHSHALFANRRRFHGMASNLVLPGHCMDVGDEPSPVETFSVSPVPINLEDMSPGIFCDPTIFDTPDSGSFSMKLPTEKEARNRDCNTISPETMVDVLGGKYGDYIVVDCRFPYEYEGGHIKDAINIFVPDPLEQFFVNKYHSPESPVSPQSPLFSVCERLRSLLYNDSKNMCIIFHCEFSQHRAPKMYRFLRELDRKVHEDTYPELYYPNIYVLEGGYKGFFEYLTNKQDPVTRSNFCVPNSYISMDDKDYQNELQMNWKQMKCGWSKKKRRSKSFRRQ